MQIFGELERLFATSLYPLRIPIGLGLIAVAVALVAMARRRGWFAAARRHPGRSAALAVVALAIGLPTAFYLASPVFIRTELIEPDPVAQAQPSATTLQPTPTARPAPSAAPSATTAATTVPATTAPTPFAPATVASGAFKGADEFHFGKGTASIVQTAAGVYTLRFEGFSVRNGPDLYVYLSPAAAGFADGALELGKLKATDGTFGYALPAGLDPTTFASAVIWCKQFAVQFAVASLGAV